MRRPAIRSTPWKRLCSGKTKPHRPKNNDLKGGVIFPQGQNLNLLTDVIFPYGGTILGATLVIWLVVTVYQRHRLLQATKKAADLVVLQVLIPREEDDPEEEVERRKDFKETMSVAEQFLASLSALAPHLLNIFGHNVPTLGLEIVVKDAIRFYLTVPRELRELVEKQVLAYYPTAAIDENKKFKVFDDQLVGAGAELTLTRRFVLPIKTYKDLESDPLNGITNAFSKLGEQGRAVMQILIRPTNGHWQDQVSHAAQAIQEGKSIHVFHASWWGRALASLGHGFGEALKSSKQNEEDRMRQSKLTPMQEETLKDLNDKASKVGYETQIRIAVLAENYPAAQTQLATITTAFAQVKSPQGNSLQVRRPRSYRHFARDLILRHFTGHRNQILTTEELTTLYHFPNRFLETPALEWLLARTLPPPVNLPQEGTILGKSVFRGEERPIRLKPNDRRRHMYMIGKTGVGKTTLFVNMIEQDIKEGKGVAYLDPNGDAVEQILTLIPPERAKDVVYFDPSDEHWPMGLNMLDWQRPEDRDFLVSEWLEIFYKLFDPNRTGMVGPQFEHWGRNASLTIMSVPGGGTLIDIPRLFVDDKYREYAVSYVTDPVVKSFWEQQLAKTSDFHKSEMFNYFISKFGRFMTNDLMRNIIGQTKSSFDFRDVMDSGKIFLINLSKGKIGETNSNLLGMVLVSKLQVAAFQRADTPEEERKDFYLYVDEFQNFTTDTFKTILSEARKYRLDLNITNQYIAQLPEDIRDAVIGNAGTILSYRIGAGDAEFLEKEFPGVTKEDMTNLPFATMYVKLLIDGTPSKTFSMQGIKTATPPNFAQAEAIRNMSRLHYGRPVARVEADIQERLKTGEVEPEPVKAPEGLKLA